jgi:RNA polymerase sigma-70 factor, ECF subfamily
MTAPALPSEDELVRRIQRGDDGAFDRLVEVCGPRVYSLAYRLVGNPDDAQDMAQEAFVRIYRALPNFKWESAFTTWLFRIVSNVCYDELARRKHRPPTLTELRSTDDDDGSGEERFESDTAVEDLWEQNERNRLLQVAISALPAHFRLVLVLCDVRGLSYQETADTLTLNVGTVKSRLNRARILLRTNLLAEREHFSTRGRLKG